jgi:hypothetical protein
MRKLHEIWKAQKGKRIRWYVQFDNGVLAFKTRKNAQLWVDVAEGTRDHLGNAIIKGET